MARYQYVAEREIRFRSVALRPLKPHRFKWVAKMWARLYCWFHDTNAYLYREHEVPAVLSEYRNWLGQNRIER